MTGEQSNQHDSPARRKRYLIALSIAVTALVVLILFVSIHKRFNHDEFEHVHTAWFVQNGYVPYTDFYQNHHPLLWVLMVPFLVLMGNSVETVIAVRLLMFVFVAVMAVSVWWIARQTTDSNETSLLSVLILLSTLMFVDKSVEIRPDVPQVCLGLLSVCFLIYFFKTKKDRYMVYAGLAASISFLFLQKAVFLLAACAVIFAIEVFKRRISIKSLACFAIPFSLPVFVFLAYLLASGSLGDYVLTCWLMHSKRLTSISPFHTLSSHKDATFLIFSAVSLPYVMLSGKTTEIMKKTALICLVLLLSLFAVKHPYRQYFMFPFALLSICVAYTIKVLFDRYGLRGITRIVLLAVLIGRPVYFIQNRIFQKNNHRQLEKVDYVVRNTDQSDFVYDGNAAFNLFRPDLHYFWYSLEKRKGLDTYNSMTENKYGDYDICRLIREKKPKFISQHRLNLAECGLHELYEGTPYEKLYIRKQDSRQAAEEDTRPEDHLSKLNGAGARRDAPD